MEAMQTTKDGLENELNQDLMATLSTRDQDEVDQLNDDIRRLKTENKKAFSERMRLEAQKNKLENLLTNNLIRRKDELVQALQEISVEECDGTSRQTWQFDYYEESKEDWRPNIP